MHYKFEGAAAGLPLLEHFGYNDFREADPLGWHAHTGFEFVFLTEGAATYEIEPSGPFPLSGGQFILTLPGARHRAENDINAPCRMFWMVLDPALPEAAQNTPFRDVDLKRIAGCCRRAGNCRRHLNRALSHRLMELRTLIEAIAHEPAGPLDLARLRTLMCQLLLDTVPLLEADAPTSPDAAVTAAIAYMRGSLGRTLLAPEIARHIGFSVSRFHQMFKEQTGQTPADYLQRLRIEQAERLLTETQTPIVQIALDCGFCSSQYFARVFAKHTRKSPTRFRREAAARAAIK
jgi:AraC-like DNA-binding protein/mannose-6-phosphate isomerase-like protein (cupin superfamily)